MTSNNSFIKTQSYAQILSKPKTTEDITKNKSKKQYGPINFVYQHFLDYYKDPKNYSIDHGQNIIKNYYFVNNKKKNKTKKYKLNSEPLSQNFITINGEKVYITFIGLNNEKILFTIPREDINGIWWDDHYHFGLNPSYMSKRHTQKNRNLKAIYFHKTIQDQDNGRSYATHCHFEDNIDLKKITIEDLKCHSDSSHTMKDEFPITSHDFTILKELIRRPFFEPYVPGGIGGRRRTCKKRRLKNRK